jgi:hypothetical protein
LAHGALHGIHAPPRGLTRRISRIALNPAKNAAIRLHRPTGWCSGRSTAGSRSPPSPPTRGRCATSGSSGTGTRSWKGSVRHSRSRSGNDIPQKPGHHAIHPVPWNLARNASAVSQCFLMVASSIRSSMGTRTLMRGFLRNTSRYRAMNRQKRPSQISHHFPSG